MRTSGQSRRAEAEEDVRGSGPARAALPGADAAFRDGETLRGRRRPREAVQRYADALLADPGHRPSLLALGATLGELRRWPDAVRAYRRAALLFPHDTAALAGLREARAQLAEAGRSRAAELAPDEARPLRAGLGARSAARPGLVMPSSTGEAERETSRARLNGLTRALGAAGFLAGGATFLGLGLRRIDMFTAYGAALVLAAVIAAVASAFFPRHWRLALKSTLVGATLGSLAILGVAVVATVVR